MGLFAGIYLSLIFFFAGLSFQYGDRLSFYLILTFPFFLLLFKKKIIFPRKMSIIWICFSVFDLVATVASTDKQLSIERLLLYQVLFLTGIYFFNYKKRLGPVIDKLILFFSAVFVIAFFFKSFLLSHADIFDVNNIFNFFFPAMPGNNHLGIWLGLAIIILFFRRQIWLLLGVIPIYLTTFSRSSYLSLILISLTYSFKRWHIKSNKKVLVFIAAIALVLVLAIVAFVPRGDITSDRIMYFREAILGFLDKPLIGYGPGNFTAISRKYAASSMTVFGTTSHNIMLDILSGSGIFAFGFFAAFLYMVFAKSRKNMYFWLLLFLFICFNTTYVFAMPAAMLLFFIFIGLSYEEEQTVNISFLAYVISLLLIAASGYLAYSEALYINNDFERSITLYPYRKEAYESLVTQIPIYDKDKINGYISSYKNHFPGLFEPYNYSAYTYKRIGEYEKSLKDYLYIFNNGTGFNATIAGEIRWLYQATGQRRKAYDFSMGFVNKVYGNKNEYRGLINSAYDFCVATNVLFLDKAYCF